MSTYYILSLTNASLQNTPSRGKAKGEIEKNKKGEDNEEATSDMEREIEN